MPEVSMNITTQNGVMPTFVALPVGQGPFPATILYMDIWGMRDQLRNIARFVAKNGFVCAAPSLYYRAGNTHFDYRHTDGRTKSISILADEDRNELLNYNAHLTDDMVVSDTAALISQLRQIDCVSDGFAGCFGYCMGGRHVVKVAAALPDVFRATASFHGTSLATSKPDSPHRLSQNIKGEIYFGIGANDPFTPPDLVETVRAAFMASDATTTFTNHEETEHGYALPDRDVYNERATNRDWEQIFAMFKRMLR